MVKIRPVKTELHLAGDISLKAKSHGEIISQTPIAKPVQADDMA